MTRSLRSEIARLRERVAPDGVCPACHGHGRGPIAIIWGHPTETEWAQLLPPPCEVCGKTATDYGGFDFIQFCAQEPRPEEATPPETESVCDAAA
jgi:hypothetical protein